MQTLTAPTNSTPTGLLTDLWDMRRTTFGDRRVHRFWPRGTDLSRSGAPCVMETTPLDAAPIWDALLIAVTEREEATSLRLAAIQACDDLRKVFGVSDSRLAEIVGISRNTIGNWRKNSHEPYPATIRNLLTAHGLVSAYRRRFGASRALLWASEHIESFSTDEGLEALAIDLRRHLLPQRPSALHDLEDEPRLDEVVSPRPGSSGELMADDATFI